jgi:hypothetical protein
MTVEFLDNASQLGADQSSAVIPFPKQFVPHKNIAPDTGVGCIM